MADIEKLARDTMTSLQSRACELTLANGYLTEKQRADALLDENNGAEEVGHRTANYIVVRHTDT